MSIQVIISVLHLEWVQLRLLVKEMDSETPSFVFHGFSLIPAVNKGMMNEIHLLCGSVSNIKFRSGLLQYATQIFTKLLFDYKLQLLLP